MKKRQAEAGGMHVSELDRVLERCKVHAVDESAYYELFLNTLFYLPVVGGDSVDAAGQNRARAHEDAVLFPSDGKTAVMLFDSEMRFYGWTNGAVGFKTLFGHVVIDMLPAGVGLTVNPGTRGCKEFTMEEIAFLKRVVARIREEIEGGSQL